MDMVGSNLGRGRGELLGVMRMIDDDGGGCC